MKWNVLVSALLAVILSLLLGRTSSAQEPPPPSSGEVAEVTTESLTAEIAEVTSEILRAEARRDEFRDRDPIMFLRWSNSRANLRTSREALERRLDVLVLTQRLEEALGRIEQLERVTDLLMGIPPLPPEGASVEERLQAIRQRREAREVAFERVLRDLEQAMKELEGGQPPPPPPPHSPTEQPPPAEQPLPEDFPEDE